MRQVRLRHVAQVNPSTLAFSKLGDDDELTFLPMEAVWPEKWRELGSVKRKSDVSSGFTRFQDGDILVPKITPTFEASRSILVNGMLGGAGAGTTELHVLRAGEELDPRYLLYLMNTQPFLDMGEAEMYGVAGQKRVPESFLMDFHIPVPSIEEQQRIADFLDAETVRMSALSDSLARSVRLFGERRVAGVIHEVTGAGQRRKRPSRLPWVHTLPESWREARVGLLARMGSGHTPNRSRPEWWTGCTIPWITTGEVAQVRDDRQETITETRESISDRGLANSAAELHPTGTVVLCRTASAGYSAVMGSDMATSQDFVTWTCGPQIDPYYLLWCLRAMRQDLLGRLATGSTHKTIYVPDLQMLRIPLPPIAEQKEIVERIRHRNESIDRAVDAIQRQIQLLNERRQALITAAVTGQIDVTTARGADVA